MAFVYKSCMLQAHRTAPRTVVDKVARRSFTASTRLWGEGAVPSFEPTSSPELDAILTQLRNHHFFPAYLNRGQRKYIYKNKYKAELENNPTSITLGGESWQLDHVDRKKDVPSRSKAVLQAVKLFDTAKDWRQLPALFEGLDAAEVKLKPGLMHSIIRRATDKHHFNYIMDCLHQSQRTGLSLKRDDVLFQVLKSIHSIGSTGGWLENSLKTAIKNAEAVALLLEQDAHARGPTSRVIVAKDPRVNPEVIGLYLELAAVQAYKFQDKKDLDQSVKKYADRLASCTTEYRLIPDSEISSVGPQHEFLRKFPLWHGIKVAKAVLGSEMPQSVRLKTVEKKYGSRLARIASKLGSEKDIKPGRFIDSALESWNSRLVQ